MNMLKRSLAMLLVLTLLFSFVPFSVFADDGESVETTAVTEAVEQRSGGPGNSDFGHSQGNGKDEHKDPLKETEAPEVTEAPTETTVPETTVPETTVPETTVPETTQETVPETTEATVPETTEETVPETEPQIKFMLSDAELNVASTDGVYTGTVEAPDEFLKVFHLDAGRKYFTVDQVKGILDLLGEKGYSHMELAIGNDGLRFLLDDMSVTVGETTYDSDTVTAGVKAGNIAYSHAGEWSEDDMEAILAYAKTKGIEIIPLVNTPGHMDAILDAMEYCGISNVAFNNSARTVDLTNETAVAFTQELVGKYMAYFASKGCNYFNIGADEYANDVSNGWSDLISNKTYYLFVDYINDLVAMADRYGMRPIAFNDGIYYNSNTSFGTFDTRLIISYWSSGWPGYNPAPASFLQGKNHLILNTTDMWYYVLGDANSTYNYDNALSRTQNTLVTSVSGAIGAMQCVWCDNPAKPYNETEQTRISTLISTLAEKNPTYFTGPNVVEPEEPEETQPTTPSEPEESATLTDTVTGVEITAPGLTAVNVTAQDAVVTENHVAKTFSVILNDGAYTAAATVKVPYDTAFDGCTVFSGEVDGDIFPVSKDGDWFICEVPHFSDITINGSVTSTHNITISVGEEYTVTDISGNYGSGTVLNNAYAQVITAGITESGGVLFTAVDSVSGGSAYYVSNTNGDQYLTASATWTDDISKAAQWTFTANGNGYTLKSGSNYLRYRNNSWTTTTNSYFATTVYFDDDTLYRSLSYNGTLSNPFGKPGTAEDKPSVNKTDITFTGIAPGETTVTVGSTTYKIVVNKKTESATISIGDTLTYADSSATDPVVDKNGIVNASITDGKLTITAKAAGTATVTTDNAVYNITVVEFDPATVTPLTVEYWITNIVTILDTSGDQITSQKINAGVSGVATAEGADINAMMPEWTYKYDSDSQVYRAVEFWHVRLLDKTQANNSTSQTEEQTKDSADDETTNGDAVTRVRYYDPGDGNGRRWQMLSGSTWLDVNQTKNQIVAYYMEVVDIQNANGTTELHVNAADWGKLGDNSPASSYADTNKYCSISLQIVYEDGSGNPATTTVADLDSKTLIFNYWDNGRGIGTFAFDTLGQFDIYQITAETGAVDVTFTGGAWGTAQVNSFSWDNNEKVVWSGESETASIYNNTSHPSSADPKDNLMWDENKEAILIRVYVRAVETEDSLSVVYIDEKFNDTLYSYNIQVPADKNFNNAMIGTPGTLENGRINVTGCGIENFYGQTQNFQTDLTKVPEAKGKYNSELYTYTGSKISDDGKTLYLYYNINTNVLKPNFVIDFGLPFTFSLSDVVGENQETLVESVSVSARYGSVSYDSVTHVFTYQPIDILPTVDVLSVNILFDGETSATTTNVGVTPATSVYYEESFLLSNDQTGWTHTSATIGNQQTAVLGARKDDDSINNYGYDGIYAGKGTDTGYITGGTGAYTSFTFTGTGFQLYGNSNNSSGYVTVMSQGNVNKMYMINTELNGVEGGAASDDQQTDADDGKTYYGLPFISETALPFGTYTVQIKQTNGENPIYLDGVRILNTINDKTEGEDNIYYNDKEDNPDFYEVRDFVLYALGVHEIDEAIEGNDSQYTDSGPNDRAGLADSISQMAGQVYNHITDEEAANAVIVDKSVSFSATDVQDLLDNGPKNELYLYPGQTLIFKVQTDRVAQLGLKAPTGSASFTLNDTQKTLNTSVDMFYEIAAKGAAKDGTTVTVTVPEGSGVLSVTLLKICDDPNAAFLPLTQADIEDVLMDLYNVSDVEPPVKPSEPVKPEIPTEPSKPVEPTEPEKPTEPEVEETKPTKPGKPEKPAKPGQNKPGKPAEKQRDAKLKITYVNLMGKKVGSATLTETGAANQRCTFSVSEIFANAPAGRNALWFLPVVVPYGGNVSIVVPVI